MEYFVPPHYHNKISFVPNVFQRGLIDLSKNKNRFLIKYPRGAGVTTILALMALRHAESMPSRKIIVGSPSGVNGFINMVSYLRRNREGSINNTHRHVKVNAESRSTMAFSNNSFIQCYEMSRLPGIIRGHKLTMVCLDNFGHLPDKYQQDLMTALWPGMGEDSRLFITAEQAHTTKYFEELWEEGKDVPVTEEDKVFHKLSGKRDPLLHSFEVLPDLTYRVGYECK